MTLRSIAGMFGNVEAPATLFVRRSVIDAGLKFNEELGVGASSPFQSGEETAFLLDAIGKGWRGKYFPDLVVYHDQVGETDPSRARKYARGFGRLLALYKYPRPYVAICLMRPTLRALLGLASEAESSPLIQALRRSRVPRATLATSGGQAGRRC